VLYVVLAIALSMVGGRQQDVWGLPRRLGLHSQSTLSLIYHVAINIGFFAVALLTGPRLLRWADAFRLNLLKRASRVGFLLLLLIAMTCIALYLGITPMFGAFVAGMVAATTVGEASQHKETIRSFSFAFFIPVYFAIVGWRINFARDFEPLFFLGFFLFACLVKAASVYLGARVAKESRAGALNIAVAMNARGGPGIVLASQAYDARIIGSGFYTTLVLLAVVTSMLAGTWLDRVKRSGRPLR
jgi:Kef-type K+ transport system membrane component KefB